MRAGVGVKSFLAVSAVTACLWMAGKASAADVESPQQLYSALNALRVDSSRVYFVRELNLRRDAVRISLLEGKLAFLQALNGRITGAVFTGRGHVLAIPRDRMERMSLARFLGVPLLDESFGRAYFRFTDNTAEELMKRLQEAGTRPAEEPSFGAEWGDTLAALNPGHALRILTDWLADKPLPYFYAGVASDTKGSFDILIDSRQSEQVMIGQNRWSHGVRFYDVWTSYHPPGVQEALPEPFSVTSYSIETTILPGLDLQGVANLTLKTMRGGERVVALELSRYLRVQSVEDAEHRALPFFQNEAMNRQEIASRGNDMVVVVLPAAAHTGQELRLRFTYRGSVISDAGNGVFFVGERGSWYPGINGTAKFSWFDLQFRWPSGLQLVATGDKIEQHHEGEFNAGHWRSSTPVSVAGFNLGQYATAKMKSGDVEIDLYANRQLEESLRQRIPLHVIVVPTPSRRRDVPPYSTIAVPDVLPQPSAELKPLGHEIAEATRFYEKLFGPFPFRQLAVSQIPGAFGQGWPGLLYLPTFTFLTAGAQRQVGVKKEAQEEYTELLPYHEVAHQWWGNLVGWESYRDQWICEGLANYAALLYADSRKNPDETLRTWLERYRKNLMEKEPGRDAPVEQAGPLEMGYRLRSSLFPDGYVRIVYKKGTWIFQMLRGMLRDPGAKDPDARFTELLRTLLREYRYRAVSTLDLQHAAEKLMQPAMDLEGTKSLDWFFDQWVRSTGIPHYSVTYRVQRRGAKYLVTGTLIQKEVPDTFLAAVPLYGITTGGKSIALGTVAVTGEETPFRFVTQVAPKELQIDPQLTLLCVVN